jgi:hypothetical protein
MNTDKGKKTEKAQDALTAIHPFALVGFGELLLVRFRNLIKKKKILDKVTVFFNLKMISLTLDGVTGAMQDRMNTHHKTKTHSMMYNINIWSCLWLFLGKWQFEF